jgi:sugar/nucleoside kinase (ribokinase family)
MQHVVGIGNAIVDILAFADDSFLTQRGIAKGSMRLIDEAEAAELTKALSDSKMISGGSAANTVVGLASFGLKAAFIGKAKTDDLGALFASDLTRIGVNYTTKTAGEGAATARSIIIVTPDGERTMNTFLGAAQNLTTADIDENLVANSQITYLEGYLWDPPEAKKAFLKAAEIAHKNGRKVALSLSDAFCVGRYRAEFLELITSKTVDIVFANESEATALYETADFIPHLRRDASLAVVTLGANGAMAIEGEKTVSVKAIATTVVDTTGAGDLFAAGFLAGYVQNEGLEASLTRGARAASEVISHLGARPLNI